jgi:hypothetical protein
MINAKYVATALSFVKDITDLEKDTTRDTSLPVGMDFPMAQKLATEIMVLALLADVNFEGRFQEAEEERQLAELIDLFSGERIE